MVRKMQTKKGTKKTAKKIAVFADGTGNSASSATKTNVWRMYKALDVSKKSNQVAFYDGGVGTSSFTPLTIIGLAFGWGLARNVRQLYKSVCYAYEHNEDNQKVRSKIYGIGFSRGAFTIRVLAAFIADQGIINKKDYPNDDDLDRQILAAYREFRKGNFDPSFLSRFFGRPIQAMWVAFWNKVKSRAPYNSKQNFEYMGKAGKETEDILRYKNPRNQSIEFLGLWDSVDAYGLPIDEMTNAWDRVVWPLSAKDRNMSVRISYASHALALDEQRESFEPMLWNEKKHDGSEDTRITQVWFAGVHANIGGGYPDDSLSHVSLNWMIDEAEKHALVFNDQHKTLLQQAADLNGPIYDNRSGVGIVYRYQPRHVDLLNNNEKHGLWQWIMNWLPNDDGQTNFVKVKTAKIHHSVFDRIVKSDGIYAPINIPQQYEVVGALNKTTSASKSKRSKKNVHESVADAKLRRAKQSNIWVDVFYGQIWYYILLTTLLLFAVYPYIANSANVIGNNILQNFGLSLDDTTNRIVNFIDQVIGSLSGFLRKIPSLIGEIPLPFMDWVGKWADKFTPYPYIFIMFIAFFLVIRWRAGVTRMLVQNNMHAAWSHLTDLNADKTEDDIPPNKKVSLFREYLAKILDIKTTQQSETVFLPGTAFGNFVGNPLRYLIECLAGIIFLIVILSLASRATFVALDFTGFICPAYSPAKLTKLNVSKDKKLSKIVKIDTLKACGATGIMMEKNTKYNIHIAITKPWTDDTLKADTRGLVKEPPFKLKIFTVFRRHLFHDWYQPILRIHNRFLDLYPLDHTFEADPKLVAIQKTQQKTDDCANNTGSTLCTTITTRRDGQLYFYVNDALIFTPDFPVEFYSNNKGEAKITVTRLPNKAQ